MRPPRWKIFLAALLSVLLHVGLIYLFMGLSIGTYGSSLLRASQPRQLLAIRVQRALEDQIIDAAPTAEKTRSNALATPDSPAGDPARKVAGASRSALAGIDGARLATQIGSNAQPARLATPQSPKIAPAAPQGRTPDTGSARPIDISSKVLSMASPRVDLPRFVAPADQVHAPSPEDGRINASTRIRLADLQQAIKQGASNAPSGTTGATPGTPLGLVGGSQASRGVPGGIGEGGVAPGIALRIGPPPAPPPALKPPSPTAPKVVARIPDPPPILATAATPVKTATIHLDDDFDYQLMLCPKMPDDPGFFGLGARKFEGEPGWFEVRITPKRSIRRVKSLHKDVVYVIDTSESIRDVWVDAVRRGVIGAMDSLNEGDRFNLVQFKDTVTVMHEGGLMAADAANKAKAEKFMSAAKSGGYTDLNRALAQLIIRDTEPDRVYQIVLISDGKPTRGSIDARQIINAITRDNDNTASIYAIGVGDEIDRVLLEFLTYRNKGFVLYLKDAGQAAAAVLEMASQLRYPIVKDAVFNAVGVEAGLIYPRLPRDLYQGQTASLFGRYTATAQRISMRLTGSSGPDVLDLTFTLDFAKAIQAGPEVATQWAFWKLHQLYSDMLKEGRSPAIQKQMDELRERYKLKTAY